MRRRRFDIGTTDQPIRTAAAQSLQGHAELPRQLALVLNQIPGVVESAVIGVPHPKWSERPLACVVVKEGESMTRDEVLDHVRPRLAKWQMPDDVVFIDEVPKTSVGKFSKKTLRDRFADHVLPG